MSSKKKFMTEEQKAASDHLPYKLQIISQAFVYQRQDFPTKEKQVTESGIVLDVLNWYKELPCKQLGVNYAGLYISEENFWQAWDELGKGIRQSMLDKGLIA